MGGAGGHRLVAGVRFWGRGNKRGSHINMYIHINMYMYLYLYIYIYMYMYILYIYIYKYLLLCSTRFSNRLNISLITDSELCPDSGSLALKE